MPGKHSPSKKFISFSISRELWYKLTQYSQEIGLDRNSFAIQLFENEMNRLGVKLNDENADKVASEIEAIRSRRQFTWEKIEDKVQRSTKKGSKPKGKSKK